MIRLKMRIISKKVSQNCLTKNLMSSRLDLKMVKFKHLRKSRNRKIWVSFSHIHQLKNSHKASEKVSCTSTKPTLQS